MDYKHILVTGGAGFIGSHIAIMLKSYYPDIQVIALDNLYRKGSELNVPRLEERGVEFVRGDVRKKEDLDLSPIDLLIECSAEPSVMAGVTSSPEYLLKTNVVGAIECFELARREAADVIFLSTSRVYPVEKLNALAYRESATRYETKSVGINESFSLDGYRTLYGATKLTAELLLAEYIQAYKLRAVVNRCGVVAGPWQMGRVDQGFIALWVSHHVFGRPLSYIGFGGSGKQVRDVLHVDDLLSLLRLQIASMKRYSGGVYNVGGGQNNSTSLLELTDVCQNIVGRRVSIKKVSKTRPGDVRVYVTDNTRIRAISGWIPKKTLHQTIKDVYQWIEMHKSQLASVLE